MVGSPPPMRMVRVWPIPSPSTSTGAPSACTKPPKSPTSFQTSSTLAPNSPTSRTSAIVSPSFVAPAHPAWTARTLTAVTHPHRSVEEAGRVLDGDELVTDVVAQRARFTCLHAVHPHDRRGIGRVV